MRLPSVRRVVLWSALGIAASATLSCTAVPDPVGPAPTTTATPSAIATSDAAAATASPVPVASHTPTATATPLIAATAATATATPLTATAAVKVTPSPLDEGIARFTDACTNADVEVDAEPRVIVERVALATGGARVTARLEPSPVVSTTRYTGGETASTVVELGPGEVVQKETSVTLTAAGGHLLTLTYSLAISGDAATAALSQVSGHCR